MSNSIRASLTKRRSDGFATLTGSMMERRTAPEGFPAAVPKMSNAAKTRKAAPRLGEDRPVASTVNYAGPERRFHDVSPVLERRRSLPPRVKISVRLEPHRYARLKAAALLLDRTHQDLVMSALDHYLDLLNIPVKLQARFSSKN